MKKMYMFLVTILIMVVTGCGSDAVPVALSSEKAITAFNFTTPAATGTVTEAAHTIAVTVPVGTVVTALVPTIIISAGASISPLSGVANNFPTPQTYTVTAADASTQDYVVTVTVASGDYTSANIGTLKYVPVGSFQRDGTAANISTITTAFRMSQYEITQAQYVAVTTAANPSYFTGATLPVERVTWFDAVEFCNDLSTLEGLTPVYTITGRNPVGTGHPIYDATVTATWANTGYRLPTEMEWEWAAMGATSGSGWTSPTYLTGYAKPFAGSNATNAAGDNGTNVIGDYAWYDGNSGATTHPVGTTRISGTIGHANELGLYDMSGNVWEWVWDATDGSYYPGGDLTNDTYRDLTSGAGRVVRGGSWPDDASYATVALRDFDSPGYRNSVLGFRVVRP